MNKNITQYVIAHAGTIATGVVSIIVYAVPYLNNYAGHHHKTLAGALILAFAKIATEKGLISSSVASQGAASSSSQGQSGAGK